MIIQWLTDATMCLSAAHQVKNSEQETILFIRCSTVEFWEDVMVQSGDSWTLIWLAEEWGQANVPPSESCWFQTLDPCWHKPLRKKLTTDMNTDMNTLTVTLLQYIYIKLPEFFPVSFDLLVLVSHCNLGTKEFSLTYVLPVVITYVGGVYLYLTLIGL